jgi:hypothetical protein
MPSNKKKSEKRNALHLVGIAYSNILENKIILYPFCVIAFIQLLFLEILYFYPRFPLKIFFTPIIRAFFKDGSYMHYPMNMVVIPQLFQKVQVPLYILFSSFFICVAISIIAAINNDVKFKFRDMVKKTLGIYVHILVGALIAYGLYVAFSFGYEVLINRALKIRSMTGPYAMLKIMILEGTPIFNLFITSLVTTLLAYVFPTIVLERKNIFAALIANFKILFGSFWFTFFIVLLPSLFYLLIPLLNRILPFSDIPDLRIVTLIFSVLVMTLIDAVVYTAITTYYLLRKEN